MPQWNTKMKKEDLAFYGGPKGITDPAPHWQWPPNSENKRKAVQAYMETEEYNEHGYPEIVRQFERAFASYHGSKYALALNSGTSTLHAAFVAVGLGPGDELIAPTMTFYATATPVLQTGATPVFCDCEPDTGNIDPDDIERRITDRTKAIVITHICGHPCEMDKIMAIAKKHGLALIEDCSHAHGATYKGQMVGTFGDISCFSLDNRKILASGEGGILLTDNQRLFELALLAGDFGPRLQHELTFPDIAHYKATGLGCKHRIHPHSAAIANEELKSLDTYIALRKEKLDYLSGKIADIPGLAPPVTRTHTTRGAYFGYRPFYKPDELNGLNLNAFLAFMHAEGMEVRQSSNAPLHRLPIFVDRWPENQNLVLKNSETFYNSTLSLPTFTFEPLDILDRYAEAFEKVCGYFASHEADSANQACVKSN